MQKVASPISAGRCIVTDDIGTNALQTTSGKKLLIYYIHNIY